MTKFSGMLLLALSLSGSLPLPGQTLDRQIDFHVGKVIRAENVRRAFNTINVQRRPLAHSGGQAVFEIGDFLHWSGRMPPDYGTALTAKVIYKMVSATANNVAFAVGVAAYTPGADTTAFDNKAFGVASTGSQTVPGTVGALSEISFPVANTDGLAAGDFYVVYLRRVPAGIRNTLGDAEVVAFSLTYTAN